MISDLLAWDNHDEGIAEFATCVKHEYAPVVVDFAVADYELIPCRGRHE